MLKFKKMLSIFVITILISCVFSSFAVLALENPPMVINTAVVDNITYSIISMPSGTVNGIAYVGDGFGPAVNAGTTSVTVPVSVKINNQIYDVSGVNWLAFVYCDRLTDVILPDSVREIGCGAFIGCSSLSNIQLPKNLQKIGDNAFMSCTALAEVNLPASLAFVGSEAFYYNTALININVDPQNTNFASLDGVLYSKDISELIAYPAGKPDASFTIPPYVKSIDDNVSQSEYLTVVNISSSITKIGIFPFGNNICNINVDNANPVYASINGVLFNKDITTIICYPCGRTDTSYAIPDTVITVGDSAFGDTRNLKSIVLPPKLKAIERAGFVGCGVNRVFFPNSLETIGPSAFWKCESLNSVYFGSDLKEVNTEAFYGDYNIGTYKFVSTPKNLTIGRDAFYPRTEKTAYYYSKGIDIAGFKLNPASNPTYIPCDPIPLPYSDVPLTHWAYKDLCAAYTDNVISPTDQFQPDAAATRLDFLEWAVKAYGLKSTGGTTPSFPDFDSVPANLQQYVTIAWQNGVLNGSVHADGKTYIDGNANVTREQYVAMLVRAKLGESGRIVIAGLTRNAPTAAGGFKDTGSISAWAAAYVDYAQANGIVKGDTAGNFNPKSDVTRAEAVTMLMRSIQ